MRKLYFPPKEDWHIETEESMMGAVGGTAVISQGRHERPIVATFGIGYDEETGEYKACYFNVLILEYRKTTDALGDEVPATLCNVAYDEEKVAEADTEEQAVSDANEYQGGETDLICEIAFRDIDIKGYPYSADSDEYFILYQGELSISPCNDNWVDECIETIEGLVYICLENRRDI